MSLLLLAYPDIEKKDFEWIQNIRRRHDEGYYSVVKPHFTIVFPVFDVPADKFIDHAKKIAKKIKQFYFVLRCATIVKDSFSDYTDVFLIPEEGYRIFVMLHDAMYTDILFPELRLDIPFIPHVGIANSKDPLKCKSLADKLNQKGIEIIGGISELTVVNYENDIIQPVEKIIL